MPTPVVSSLPAGKPSRTSSAAQQGLNPGALATPARRGLSLSVVEAHGRIVRRTRTNDAPLWIGGEGPSSWLQKFPVMEGRTA